MGIVTVVGARPQFVKAAIVSKALSERGIQELLIHTGQHYDDNMSRVFFDELGIPSPDFNLGIGSLPHGAQTGRMMEGIEEILHDYRPELVLVYGDTNSTLAGALAAAKMRIPVAHVEAGFRAFNRNMPEEINRVLTDHLSNLLFAPTLMAVENLSREGITGERVCLVGDVMYDAALHYGSLVGDKPDILRRLGVRSAGYILATIHRAENVDVQERLLSIVKGLLSSAEILPVVLPLHPRTKRALEKCNMLDELSRGAIVIDPVSYLEMVALEKHARVVVTDSGGVQKEAFFYRIPCVTLRDQTEWTELVAMGWNKVVSPSSAEIVEQEVRQAMSRPVGQSGEPYGDGKSATRIAQTIAEVAPHV